jgi:hypothetical protein
MKKEVETPPMRTGDSRAEKAEPPEKREWETPRLEDVSEQVMAQPYIRFT